MSESDIINWHTQVALKSVIVSMASQVFSPNLAITSNRKAFVYYWDVT